MLLATFVAMTMVAVSFAQTPDPVVLILQSEASVAGPIVKIGDIARLDGGSGAMRDAFAKLDVGEFQAKADRLVVSRNDVKFRLLVGGHMEKLFVIAGPPRCIVGRRSSPLSEEAARRAMQEAVAIRAPELAKFLVAKLDAAPNFPPIRLDDKDHVRLEGRLLDQGLPLGRTRGQLLVLVNGEQKAVVPAPFDVTFAQAQSLEIPERSGPLIPMRERPSLLSPVAPNVETTDTPELSGILVRSRDRVQMVAIIGRVNASAPGEALQDGRLGQMINVRNIDSSKVVSGRVTGKGIVEIERRTGTLP